MLPSRTVVIFLWAILPFAQRKPLFRNLLGLQCIVFNLCLRCGYDEAQKLVCIVLYLISFLYPMEWAMWFTFSRIINLRSINNISWIFSIYSGVAISIRRLERSANLMILRTLWNFVNPISPLKLMVQGPYSIHEAYPWSKWAFFPLKPLCLFSLKFMRISVLKNGLTQTRWIRLIKI